MDSHKQTERKEGLEKITEKEDIEKQERVVLGR